MTKFKNNTKAFALKTTRGGGGAHHSRNFNAGTDVFRLQTAGNTGAACTAG